MKDQDLFLDDVMAHAPGCPVETARAAIRQSAIEFCFRSDLLRYEVGPLDVRAGETEYDFEAPPQTGVHRLLHAWFRDRELSVLTPDDPLAVSSYREDLVTGAATPTAVIRRTDNTFHLLPSPSVDADDALFLTVAVRPLRTATRYADELYADWLDAIAHGALYRLMLSPAKPYTDVNGAAVRRQWFEAAVAQARAYTNKGKSQASMRVASRPFV